MSAETVNQIYKVTDEAIYGFFKDHRFLSNFHLHHIEWGFVFGHNEAAYQAAKCKKVSDMIAFTNTTPAEAKKLGRKVELREDWEEIKDDIMFLINWKKFQDIVLQDQLLATGTKYLEETNYWGDRYWGVCNGQGQNKLGVILMRIREILTR